MKLEKAVSDPAVVIEAPPKVDPTVGLDTPLPGKGQVSPHSIEPDSTSIPVHAYTRAKGIEKAGVVQHATAIGEPSVGDVGGVPITTADVERWQRVASFRKMESLVSTLPKDQKAEAETWMGLHHALADGMSVGLADPDPGELVYQGRLAEALGEMQRIRTALGAELPAGHELVEWMTAASADHAQLAELAMSGDAWENPGLRKAVAVHSQVEVAARHMLSGQAAAVVEEIEAQPKRQARWLRGQADVMDVLLGARLGATFTPRDDHDFVAMRVVAHRMTAHTGRHLSFYRMTNGDIAVIDKEDLRRSLMSGADHGDESAAGIDLGRARVRLGEAGFAEAAFAAGPAHPASQLINGPGRALRDVSDACAMVKTALSAHDMKPKGALQKPVERVAIITHNRPDRLAGVLSAYADNLEQFGHRKVELVVLDDSSGAVAEQNRAVVELIRARGHTVRYVGANEKSAIRQRLQPGLGEGTARSAEQTSSVLDKILGAPKADGSWRGGAHAQRNWISLLFAGSRSLVVDDDTRPCVMLEPRDALAKLTRPGVVETVAPTITAAEVLRAELVADLDARPRRAALIAGTILEDFAAGKDVDIFQVVDALSKRTDDTWLYNLAGCLKEYGSPLPELDTTSVPATESDIVPIDIVGAAQQHRDVMRSASYQGHRDVSAEQVIKFFLEPGTASLNRLEGGLDLERSTLSGGGNFRGSTFVTTTSLDGVDFAYRHGRDQDFTLDLTRKHTSAGRHTQRGGRAGFTHLHERGLRYSTQPRAMLQEMQTKVLHSWIGDAFDEHLGQARYSRWAVTVDPLRLRDEALAMLNGAEEKPDGKSLAARIAEWAPFERGKARDKRREVDAMLKELTAAKKVASAGSSATVAAYAEWFAPRVANVNGAAERLKSYAETGPPPLDEIARYLDSSGLPPLDELGRELGQKEGKAIALRRELMETFMLQGPKGQAELVESVTESMKAELEMYFEGVAVMHTLQQRLPSLLQEA